MRLRLSTTDIFLTVPGLVGRLDGLCAGLSSLVVGLVGLLEGRLSPPAADDFRRCSLPEEGAMLDLSEDTLGLVGAASVETAGLPTPKMDSRLSMDCLCEGAAARAPSASGYIFDPFRVAGDLADGLRPSPSDFRGVTSDGSDASSEAP